MEVSRHRREHPVRFVGKRSLEDTITQTNLEAPGKLPATAHSIHRRMIVVDFIDMDRSSNRNKNRAAVQRFSSA